MRGNLGKIFVKLFNYIEQEDIKGLIRYCLIILPFVVGGILGIAALINYLWIRREILIILGIASCFIIPLFIGKKAPKATPAPPVIDSNVVFFNRLLTQALFNIFTTYSSQFQTLPPQRFSDLQDDLPSGMDLGKNVAVYRFKVISDGEGIEPANFHEILNVHLHERVTSGELSIGKPVAEFGGQLIPKLFIDECVYAGGVWHFTLMICDNENVARYIGNKRQTIALRNCRISSQYQDSDF